MPAAHHFGKTAEALAIRWLRKHGYQIVEQNLRLLGGELDIVAQDKDTLVFIEVKGRRTNQFGGASYAIDERKKRQIIKLASFYRSERGLDHQPCRFDAIFVTTSKENIPEIAHIQDAFEVSSSDWQW